MNRMPFKRLLEFKGQKYVLVHETDYARLRRLITECESVLTTAYERAVAAGDDDLANKLASAVYDIDGWEGSQFAAPGGDASSADGHEADEKGAE